MRSMLILAAVAALVLAAPASAKVKRLEANLSGSNEMPAADPSASGTTKLRLDRAKRKVCFTIRVHNVEDVVSAHIHKGGKSVASGSIVVTLLHGPAAGSKFTGCETGVGRGLIRAILRHPRRYYVNVHSVDFPGGEVRGQLHKP